MTEITVKRYDQPAAGYAGTIEPADRAWILWIDVDGAPSLWTRVESEDGASYVPAAA